MFQTSKELPKELVSILLDRSASRESVYFRCLRATESKRELSTRTREPAVTQTDTRGRKKL